MPCIPPQHSILQSKSKYAMDQTQPSNVDKPEVAEPTPSNAVRKRTRRACDKCSNSRARCDGQQPWYSDHPVDDTIVKANLCEADVVTNTAIRVTTNETSGKEEESPLVRSRHRHSIPSPILNTMHWQNVLHLSPRATASMPCLLSY